MEGKVMELLAPAGGMDSIYAAVHSGADAVYLGAKMFSARANAKNFDQQALEEAVRYCHLFGVKVYQAINTVVFDREMPLLVQVLQTAAAVGIDAMIVQDLGVAAMVRNYIPDMPLHASTQMTICNIEGVRQLEKFHFKRAVLARELSLQEIEEIRQNTQIELEVFVHGALCMCVSGQCYLSSFIGGRSANRGNCAQPCRLPFSDTGQEKHALSLKDLNALNSIEKLKAIGIDSIKIEGRMKRPEYVGAAVHAYRYAIDGKSVDAKELEAIFSRSGFTNGYLENKRDSDMFGVRQKHDVVKADERLLKSIQSQYKNPPQKIAVDFALEVCMDKTLKLKYNDIDGNKGVLEGEVPEQAHHRSLQQEDVVKALGKLGGTPYYAREIMTTIQEGCMVPASALNALRRRAAGALSDKRNRQKPKAFIAHPFSLPKSHVFADFSYWASFADIRQLSKEIMQYFDHIILDADTVWANKDMLMPYLSKILVRPSRLQFEQKTRTAELKLFEKLKLLGFNCHLICNIAQIKAAKDMGYRLYGDFTLNITNSISLREYNKLGLEMTLLSP